MPSVFIVGGGHAYQQMFLAQGWVVTNDFSEADLIQFTGGEDVSPSLYGEERHRTTHSNMHRDKAELLYFSKAIDEAKKIAGICRGGQFLNVMCGGKLWQNVDRHAIGGTHACVDVKTGHVYQVTSTHHQMMREGPAGVVLATAALSTFKQGQTREGEYELSQLTPGAHPDVEVVLYEEQQCLCFQPHPEFEGSGDCTAYYFYLLASELGLTVA